MLISETHFSTTFFDLNISQQQHISISIFPNNNMFVC
jgi:hypothetical protein